MRGERDPHILLSERADLADLCAFRHGGELRRAAVLAPVQGEVDLWRTTDDEVDVFLEELAGLGRGSLRPSIPGLSSARFAWRR
jgi:hypothetical protein